MRDDRVKITVLPDWLDPGAREFNGWLACFDADGSPYMDASGPTPELALASLAQKLASALLDEKALVRAEDGT